MSMDDRFVVSNALKARLRAGENKAAVEAQVANRAVQFVDPDTTSAGDFQGAEGDPPTAWGPVGSLAATMGINAASATWTASSPGSYPFLGYAVELRRVSDNALLDSLTTVLLNATFTGLVAGVPVTVRVRATDISDLGPWTTSNNVTPADPGDLSGTVPGPPRVGYTGATAPIVGDQQVTLFWEPPISDGGQPITGYQITPYVYTNDDIPPYPGTAQTPIAVGNVNTYTVTGLDNVTVAYGDPAYFQYVFIVQAINVIGISDLDLVDYVDNSSYVRPGTPPGALGSLVATLGGDGVAIGTWTAPSVVGTSPLSSYSFELHRVNDPPGLYALSGSGGTTSYQANSLTPGNPVYFEVAASNSTGLGPWSTSNTVTPTGTVPAGGLADPPTNVTAVAGYETATFTWEAPLSDGGQPITGYRLFVYRVTGDAAPYDYPGVDITASGFGAAFTTSLTHKITGLVNGARYYAKVLAVNLWGHSAGGESDYVIPDSNLPPDVAPVAVTNLVATAGPAASSVTATWTAPATGTSPITYAVRVHRASDNAYLAGANSTVIPTTIASAALVSGVEVYMTVEAFNYKGSAMSGNSNSVTVL